MTRSKWLFVIANAIVVINVALWVGINVDLGNAVTAVNYAFLIFTCALPSAYLVIVRLRPDDPIFKESLVPSLIVTAAYVLLNLIASILLLILNKNDLILTLMIEVIFLSVYLIVMIAVIISSYQMKKLYAAGKENGTAEDKKE